MTSAAPTTYPAIPFRQLTAENAPLDNNDKPAVLTLKDGLVFEGFSFGAEKSMAGEVVFNTGMVGYPESLTDPSYRGQILVLTYPMVGNYGVPGDETLDSLGLPAFLESYDIHIAGLVVSSYSVEHSHWNSVRSLGEWLASRGVPAMYGVDTRALTKVIRNHGSLLGKIEFEGQPVEFANPNERHLVAEVSTRKTTVYGKGNATRILAFDCGMKYNIIRCFAEQCQVEFTVVPFDYDLEANVDGIQYDGVFVSNGPGDPVTCAQTINSLKWLMAQVPCIPIFGICLGNQLLALAAGGSTYKMKFGNRGMNQPAIDMRTSKCYITPQNHGYAVDAKSLPEGWKTFFVNANDFSNEGIIHETKPWSSVQFHPEAAGGPMDTNFLFATFIGQVRGESHKLTLLEPHLFETQTVKKVLLLGSGGLSIGQAGEFDYSGSQAIKALKEEGLEVVLINPNIATVQTSKNLGGASPDRTYFLPVKPDVVEEVIKKERPDGIVVSMGGQTALNVGVTLYNSGVLKKYNVKEVSKKERLDGIVVSMGGQTALNVDVTLYNSGVLKKYNVKVLGTPIASIIATEDRDEFAQKLNEIGEKMALSYCATTLDEGLAAAKKIGFPVLIRAAFALGGLGRNDCATALDEGLAAARKIGFPVLIRAAFALGGLGSGFAETEEEFLTTARKAFSCSDQIIIDQDLRGWKEVEYEVVRDNRDNCITVCNMENFDPLGVHTGDSIVVAPSQTLSNSEYFKLRLTALKVVRHLGIVGECNIQYALNPHSEEYCIIEVNARLSRSSALASKATGYPLAYVAAKLALGKDLVSIRNSVTQEHDRVLRAVARLLRRQDAALGPQEVSRVSTRLGSSMTSVGEVMAIGRTFEEAIQKAVRMVDPGSAGLEGEWRMDPSLNQDDQLRIPTDQRLFAVMAAMEDGRTVDDVHNLSRIDRWFLAKLRNIALMRKAVKALPSPQSLNANSLRTLKCAGFSDLQLARYMSSKELEVRALRQSLGVTPRVKQIDTLAAEFPAATNYLYMTYSGSEDDIEPENQGIMVLGCGAYCIGSSVEFDWCAVSCVRQLRTMGYKAIVVNFNPETVSTDYDESDRLYFEELSFERVMDIYEWEAAAGVVVSVGGQIPQNIAMPLHLAGATVLGTRPEDIDRAEDRDKFSAMLDSIGVDQPEWSSLTSIDEALIFADRVGFPCLVRPSFVLSGAAMAVASTAKELADFLRNAGEVANDKPVVISKFIEGAKEIEFDGVSQGGNIINYAISEHVENAGVHSGDATLLLPAQKLWVETIRRVKRVASAICKALNISGPFNIQLMARENEIKVIECNLRASRTFPFISKTLDANFITLATKVMLGMPVKPYRISLLDIDYVAVKAPMFSFTRLRGADPTLGVEMASTGEVACFGRDSYEAFLQALRATNFTLPSKDKEILISFAEDRIRAEFLPWARELINMGYKFCGTPGTAAYYEEHGVSVKIINKPAGSTSNGTPAVDGAPMADEYLKQGSVDLVINIPEGTKREDEITSGYLMRRTAVDFGVGLLTNVKCATLLVDSLLRQKDDVIRHRPPVCIEEYYGSSNKDAM